MAGGRRLPALQAGAGRLRTLLTDSTVESSMAATSLARKPRTSRKTRTASWRGGRICRAVTNARETVRPDRSGPPGRAAHRSRLPARRPETAATIRPRRGGSALGVRPQARPIPSPGAGQPRGARPDTGWWRLGTARCAARRGPRTRRGPARRSAACSGGHPRHPRRIRASDSSAPAAREGTAPSAPGTPHRPRPGPSRSHRLPSPSPSPSSGALPHVHHVQAPAGERTGRPTGGQFPAAAAPTSMACDNASGKENRHRKDRDQRTAEHLPRRSGPGSDR